MHVLIHLLVKEGLYYLNLMKNQFKIELDIIHHNCIIDLFSRSGKLEEGRNYINQLKSQNIKLDVKKIK